MKDTVKDYLDKKKRRASRQKKVVATLLSLSLVVATGVTWSLHQTGESLAGETYCGKVEHTHTDACLKKETEQTDTKAAETEKVLTCTLPEHTHTDACITKTLICGMEEGQGAHTHTADCYQEQKTLTCTQAEHVHGEGCYDADGNLICEIPEHTHGEECYTAEQVLVCGQEESAGHVHTDACYEITYTCGMEEHTHTDACYSTVEATEGATEAATEAAEVTKAPEYTCGLEEHKHTLQCYSNPNADLETASVWEQTIAGVQLTGDYGKDVVAIAKTQLGYHESTANYNVVKADDGTEKMKGYTRYGAWYGSPYEDWCAMFASFCISYAHVDYPLEASCPNWIDTLAATGRYSTRDAWTPAIGDLVFFDQNGDGTSDHVGIVEALTKGGNVLGDDADLTTADGIMTIEGNTSDQVAERSYSRSDGTIMGYGVLPVKEKAVTTMTKTAECEGYTVTASYDSNANIPDDAVLVVEKSETTTDAAELSQTIAENAGTTTDGTSVTPLFRLKIGFQLNGEEIEPAEGSEVKIEIAVSDGLAVEDGTTLGIVHYKSDGSTETVGSVEMSKNEEQNTVISFQTRSFSEFQVYAVGASAPTMDAGTELYNQLIAAADAKSMLEIFDDASEDAANALTADQLAALTAKAEAFEDDTEGYKSGVLAMLAELSTGKNEAQAAADDYNYTVGLNSGVVNFFIAYDSEHPNASTTTTWVKTYNTTMYGSYACRSELGSMSNDGEVLYPLGSDGATGNAAVSNDTTIRNAVTGAFTVTRGNRTYSVKLGDFPDDEEVLSSIRNQKSSITVGTTTYQPSEITSDKFDVRWIVVKYNGGDGWHVDGILVRRDASLTVKKTFVGEEAAIEAAENGFKINVNSTDYSISDATQSGNTYTWVITGLKPGQDYDVTESGYEANGYLVSSSYAVTQSSASANDITGTGATATAKAVQSYSSTEKSKNYQTVAFTNVYTEPYKMTILKRDSTSLNPLSGVKFDLTVTKSDGTTDTRVITSGADGIAAIDFSSEGLGGPGTYTFSLKEQANQGYEALPEVTGTVTVGNDGKVTISNLTGGVVGNNTLVSIDTTNYSTIYIDNRAERAKVSVTKTWEGVNDSGKLPVTVQLLRNGTVVAGMSEQLSSSNNWTVTWSDLPYYVDGAVAHYTVRETWIGEPDSGTAYNENADSGDGYANYIVTQRTATGTETATDESGTTYTVYTSAISLTNCPDNGQVVITKVEEGTYNTLSGAEFTVYSDSACTTAVSNGTYTSGSDGKVTISGLAAGTYYVKETKAPDGYALSGTVYTLTVKSRNSTLTLDGSAVTTVTNEKLYVDLQLTKTDNSTSGNKKALPGAQFALYKGSGDSKQYYGGWNEASKEVTWQKEEKSYTSDSNGLIDEFTHLPVGAYTLVETAAPDGYNKLTYTITVTVSSTGTVTISKTGGENITSDSNSKTDDGRTICKFNVENSTGTALPMTGGPGTTLFTLSGLLLITASLVYGCGLGRRRKRRAD